MQRFTIECVMSVKNNLNTDSQYNTDHKLPSVSSILIRDTIVVQKQYSKTLKAILTKAAAVPARGKLVPESNTIICLVPCTHFTYNI